MKQINYILLVAIALCFGTSCGDFLEEDNRSNVTAESFYTTEEGFDALINANYSKLRDLYGDEIYLYVLGTDLYGRGREEGPEGLAKYTELNPSSAGVEVLYENAYAAIQTANQALFYATQVPDTDAQAGEVKYLRANAYFLLVQTYGGVPLVTDYITEPILEFTRASESEIYDFIISELEEAANMVGDGSYEGRVNRRAVNNLLAKVYLTRGYQTFGSTADFTTAASLYDGVIGGQELTLTPEELWTPGNELNEEVIFSVQYSAGSVSADPSSLGNTQSHWFSSYLGGSEVAGDAPLRSYETCPTDFTLSLFTEDDLRWGSTFMSTCYNRYFDYYDVSDKSGLSIFHRYAPAWESTAEDSIAFAQEHPTGMWHAYGTYGAQVASLDYQTIPVKKFDDPSAPFGENTSTRDIIVARVAESYLAAAEAHLVAGNTTAALQHINAVRTRAGVAAATEGDLDIDYILDERARELLGEYYRWFDLKRTGKLIERASLHNPDVQESNFVGTGGELKILRPIPQGAIDLNQNRDFQQNPAYN